ncbi:hypothetical protein RN001_004113 [Aquatica leii]|uniref:Uncharacterized protein n=1 Tax=Aquatica leii TaxID=1421715 RepID=A0AAN7QA53_9COLE|nr:hypothetical protein RN001_004113 [Aquatica leii]
MVGAINAMGNTIPPLLVFPRKYFKHHMIKNSPPGTIGAASPFEKTGIYPFNSNIFTDDDFLPSSITDRPGPTSIINQETLTISQSKGSLPENDNILDQPYTSADPNSPSTSGIGTVKRNVTKEGREELGIVSPEMLRPYPTAPLRKRRSRTRGRKKGKCSIITDTPEKDELMKAEEERNNKSKKKGAKAKIVTTAKKKHCFSDSDTDGNIPLHDESPLPRDFKEYFSQIEQELDPSDVEEKKNSEIILHALLVVVNID